MGNLRTYVVLLEVSGPSEHWFSGRAIIRSSRRISASAAVRLQLSERSGGGSAERL